MAKGWRGMIVGEPMPDKNDPKYRDRYEKEVETGRKFARWCRIDKLAEHIQRFALLHRNWFLVIVFGLVGSMFMMNVYRLGKAYHHRGTVKKTVIERQDSILKLKRLK